MKAKRFWDRGWTGIVKKASFRSRTMKWVVVPGMRQESVGVGYHRVYRSHCHID
jgi:hypothetical protein